MHFVASNRHDRGKYGKDMTGANAFCRAHLNTIPHMFSNTAINKQVPLAQAVERWTANRKIGISGRGKVDSAFHPSGVVKTQNEEPFAEKET